jgi:transposase
MGFCKISPDMKECALKLWDQGWDAEDIINTLGISRASLYRWQAVFDQYGSVNRPPTARKGPERIITRAVLSAVQTLYENESDLYLDELVLWLGVEHNIAISVSALHATLKTVGLTRKVLHKIAIERDEELRQQWQEMLVSDDFLPDGSQFICLDETSKNELTYARKYGRAYSGEHAELTDVFVRGDRYSLVAALTIEGYIASDAVPGSLDSIDFLEFIQENVVCSKVEILHKITYSFQLPQMNPYPDCRSVLVLDNCRIHHNEALVDMVRAAGCLILYLPSYSPDFNPIEESFSTCSSHPCFVMSCQTKPHIFIVKAYLRRHGAIIRQDGDPINALLEACGCITPVMAKNWFRHAGYIQ